VEAAFRGLVRLRGVAYDAGLFEVARVAVPVVSVGNISVGGAGKTPVARWLVGELRRRGHLPAILHGGYAMDEPDLHRLWHPDLPVLVGRDRVASARRALAAGASVLVLDDGFQHRRLARDLDLVLVAAEGWAGRRRLLPRGPWRESTRALARAQAIVVTRKVAPAEEARALLEEFHDLAPGAAVVQLHLRPSGWRRHGQDGEVRGGVRGACGAAPETTAGGPAGAPAGEVLAVTAIARPELFVANARAAGAQVGGALCFRDHHGFTARDLDRIRREAAGRRLVTTAKDLVKLAPLAPDLELWDLEQEVVVEEGMAELAGLLDGLDAGATGAANP
jgi:tetraacyldisaccharide 4'-kinase